MRRNTASVSLISYWKHEKPGTGEILVKESNQALFVKPRQTVIACVTDKRGVVIISRCVCLTKTFLPGDSRPRSSRGLAVQDDWHAVDHGAVGGSGCDIRGDAWGETKHTEWRERAQRSKEVRWLQRWENDCLLRNPLFKRVFFLSTRLLNLPVCLVDALSR